MLEVDVTAMGPEAIEEALDQTRGNGDGEDAMPSAELLALLEAAVERGASDVHLVPGYRPTFRIHGQLRLAGEQVLNAQETQQMVASLIPERSRDLIDESKNLDCSVSLVQAGVPYRFRASVYLAQGEWCGCLRHIPNEIPSFEWLGFPVELAQRLVSNGNGLVIITGVTGSGKTATLAALVNLLRQDAIKRVLTVEEPIEYIHSSGKGGIVTQREVGRDVDSFADGLKHGLRQDPDVILVGEIRDRETAQMALSAAETGHLILTTLHTRDAKGALTRLVDIFPQEAQDDIRGQLAMSLRSVVCQHLLPAADEGEKRALALEVLHVNQPVQVAIRSGKIESIESALQTGKRDGMISLDEDLQRLVKSGIISTEVARRFAKDPASIVPSSQAW
ncbi:MAG: PilT/PilU family type 4a pilus ATPase [Phycisphaerae bacterium]|nr:PilT/PilU family type 4a pilus ATPase [Phycisphaerae bacterium]